MRRQGVPIAIALGSGLLLGLAFPPVGMWPLAVVAVAAFLVVCHGRTPRHGALLGLLFGLAFFLVLMPWLRVVGIDAWIGLSLLQAGFFALLGATLALVSRLRWWLLWSACLWVGQELLRARIPFGGLPWGRLAFAQVDSPFAPYAALGGAPLTTFTVALAGTLLAFVIIAGRSSMRRSYWLVTVAAGGVLAIPLAGQAIPLPVAGNQQITVAVVQGNVPRLGLDFLGQQQAVLNNHVRQTERLVEDVTVGRFPQPDLVIWPENSSDLDPFANPAARAQIDAAARAVGVPIVVGAVVNGPGPDQVRNTAIAWNPHDGPGQTYVKRHPMPFGEYVPLRGLLTRFIDRFERVPRDFVPGQRVGLLEVGPARIGAVICFEVAYDSLVRDVVIAGGRAIVVQTNNATFGGTGQPEQQLAISRLRAIEHGRTVLIAATSGISAIVTPDGTVVQRSAEFTPEVLVQRVALRDTPTFASRIGIFPEWALAMLGFLSCFAGFRRKGRRMSDPGNTPTTGVARYSDLGKILVVIPTYNEADNIERIIRRVRAATPDVKILVTDDNSPDGTGKIADQLAERDDHVEVLHRHSKQGLGAAYLAGFRWGLERGYDVFVEMDADGSHQPEQLPRLLDALANADLVLGSRWAPGGQVRNWPLSRKLLSRGGNTYARLVLGIPIRDATGGYRAFRRRTLEGIALDDVTSQGYCFQIDMAWRTIRNGLRVVEIPITFVERELGASKMGRHIIAEALWRVACWGLEHRLGRFRMRPRIAALR